MAPVRKFLFDTSFDNPEDFVEDEPEAVEEEVEEVPTYSQEQLDAARQEGFEAGHEKGVREAADAIERRVADVLGAIGAAFDDLFQRQTDMHAEALRDAVSVAVVITRKLFPEYSRRSALGEVETLVRAAMEKALGEPRVLITVHPELEESLAEPVGALADGKGYEGHIVLRGDDAMPIGDARVEWTNGGMARDTATLWQEIDDIVGDTLGTDDRPDIEGDTDHDAVMSDNDPSPAAADTAAIAAADIETETGASEVKAAPGGDHG